MVARARSAPAVPAAVMASISAWGPPGAEVDPSNARPSSVTTTAPTHGLGGATVRAREAAAMARAM